MREVAPRIFLCEEDETPGSDCGMLRVGTRGSALAVAQTTDVARALSDAGAEKVAIVRIVTHGDINRAPLTEMGGTGVFVTALRDALLKRQCDVAVHSFKDLPTAAAPGIVTAAVPVRADARDALITRTGATLNELPAGATVGTGSPRRKAALLACRADVRVREIRGNIDTRIGYVQNQLDGVVLAAAGLTRLGREDEIVEFFPLDGFPTAPAQGALSVETRDPAAPPARETAAAAGAAAAALACDQEILRIAAALTDPAAFLTAHAERGVLAFLQAGCAAPVAAHAHCTDRHMTLNARVYSLDGIHEVSVHTQEELPGNWQTAWPAQRDTLTVLAEKLGARAGAMLLEKGAAKIAPLHASKQDLGEQK